MSEVQPGQIPVEEEEAVVENEEESPEANETVEANETIEVEEEPISPAKALTKTEEDRYIRALKSFYTERGEYFSSRQKTKLLKAKLKKGEDVKDLLESMGIFKVKRVVKKGVEIRTVTLRPEPATYLPNGDLTVQTKDQDTSIAIPSYRPPTNAELLTLQTEYDAALQEQVDAFELAREELRKAIDEDRDVLQAQRKVYEEDLRLQIIRYAERGIQHMESVELRHLLFDQPLNVSKINIGAFNCSRLPVQSLYAMSDETAPAVSEEALKAVEEAKEAEGPEEPGTTPILAFSIPENMYGELSSWAPAAFKIFGIQYNNAYQAIMAMLADELEKDEEAEVIRATSSAEEVMKYESLKDETEEVWKPILERIVLDVNRAKFEQNPELAEILKQTGDAQLVFVPPEKPEDTFLGVGLAIDNRGIKKPQKWRGERIFGKALELIRAELQATRVSLLSRAAVKSKAAPPSAAKSQAPAPSAVKSQVAPAPSAVKSQAPASVAKSQVAPAPSAVKSQAPPSAIKSQAPAPSAVKSQAPPSAIKSPAPSIIPPPPESVKTQPTSLLSRAAARPLPSEDEIEDNAED